jgi:hypothetical protein
MTEFNLNEPKDEDFPMSWPQPTEVSCKTFLGSYLLQITSFGTTNRFALTEKQAAELARKLSAGGES